MYIISACLLGTDCKYNSGNNYCEAVEKLIKGHNYIAVCPEVAGGFSTPRRPAEIRKGRVYRPDGEDVTEGFWEGAKMVFNEVQRKSQEAGEEIEMAILKARSPSCGSGTIYDGAFSGTVIKGDGVFAQLLKQKGIKVITEEDIL
ncbi:MAG: DUF523 domain-containing protein [Eubacteriales bacterium]|nr:DUF523 domain-containing protein [Eubacteriales bacterium]